MNVMIYSLKFKLINKHLKKDLKNSIPCSNDTRWLSVMIGNDLNVKTNIMCWPCNFCLLACNAFGPINFFAVFFHR